MKTVLIAIVLFALAIIGALATSWHSGDAITKARMHTQWLLFSHQVLDRDQEIREWLLKYHGEAPGSEVMNVFAAWSVRNPSVAEKVAVGIPASEQPKIASRIGWAAVDSGVKNAFLQAFRNSGSPVFRSAVAEIRSVQNLPPNNAMESDQFSVTAFGLHSKLAPHGGR